MDVEQWTHLPEASLLSGKATYGSPQINGIIATGVEAVAGEVQPPWEEESAVPEAQVLEQALQVAQA